LSRVRNAEPLTFINTAAAGGTPHLIAWLIVAVFALLIGQAIVLAVLLRQSVRRRQVEARLAQAERRGRLIANVAAVGVWECDLKTGIGHADWQLNHLLGYEAEDLPNRLENWRQLVHPDDREAVERLARMSMQGELSNFELEHRMLHRNGTVRWFRSRAEIVERNGDRPLKIAGSCMDVTQHTLEQNAFRDSEARAHALAGKLISVQEVERTRIARELHDNTGQRVAMLSIGLGMMMRDLDGASSQRLRAELKRLQDHATALGDEVRHFSHQLHPGVLQHAGLVAALSEHCAEVAVQHGLHIDFNATEIGAISTHTALCLYRVAQETLHNIAKHAQATRVHVDLTRDEDGLKLSISDDGRGFDPAQAQMAGGLGLISLEERVRLLVGTLTIEPNVERGTRVRVQLPEEGEDHASRQAVAR
jgi:PAS domain S-box-containing protein